MDRSEVYNINLNDDFHILMDYEKIESMVDDALASDFVKIIVIKASSNLDDSANRRFKKYFDCIYYDDLYMRLSSVQKILLKIYNSPKSIYFCSGYDCTGMNFSFAYSCKKRFWFNAYSRVGFPEVALGVFPALSLIGGQTPVKKELIRAGGVCNSFDGKAHGIINDLWLWGDLESELLRLEVMRLVSDRKFISEKVLVGKDKSAEEPNIDRNRELKLDRCRSLSIARRMLENQRAGADQNDLLSNLFSFYCYDLVSLTFKKWLTYQSFLYAGRDRKKIPTANGAVVIVDITNGRPRGVVLKKLILLFELVVFVSNSDEVLFKRSQSIFRDLREMKFGKGFDVTKKISFYKGSDVNQRYPWLVWNDKGSMELFFQGRKTKAVITDLYADKKGSCVEFRKTKDDDQLYNLFSHLFLIRLESEDENSDLVLSLAIRAILLKSILSLSSRTKLSAAVVVEGLQKRGWHLPSYSVMVDGFLSLAATTSKKLEVYLADKKAQNIFDLNKSEFVKYNSGNKIRYSGQSYELSNDLIVLLYEARKKLVEEMGISGYSSETLDSAFVLLTGFPSRAGSFDKFIEEFGVRRFKAQSVAILAVGE